jgi:hypothetical protein
VKKEMTFCAHCKKYVHFVVRQPPAHQGHANLPDDDEVVCLDFGEPCEGTICPLSGLPQVVMGIRLGRSGEERTGGWSVVNAVCEECSFPTELKVLDENSGLCTVCGSVNRLALLKLADGSYVAATGKEPDA